MSMRLERMGRGSQKTVRWYCLEEQGAFFHV